MTTKKKLIITIAAIVLIGLWGALVYFTSDRQKTYVQEPERAGEFTVVSLNDTNNDLYNSFVNDEYLQIKRHLSDFIEVKGGNPVDTVTITNVKRPVRSGGIYSFNAEIPSLNKTVQVTINKPPDASFPAYFLVENENYRVDLLEVSGVQRLD